jgi:hypothetical protein
MNRRKLIFGLIASSPYVGVCRADTWLLISKEEFEREKSAPHIQAAPLVPLPGAPTIKVEEPDTTKPIISPVTIRVSFHPEGNAKIDLNSFKVTYGFWEIDITGRILAHAKPSASGIFVKDAQLPAGHHKITVEIADDSGRLGIQSFEVTVV